MTNLFPFDRMNLHFVILPLRENRRKGVSEMAAAIIVVSKAKAYVRERHNMRLSEEYLEALNNEVRGLIDRSVQNVESGRVTLKARDLKPE